jgi:hypothetical protein
MKDWIRENPVLFIIMLVVIAGTVMAVAGLHEAGLASLTGAFGVMSERLNTRKEETEDAKEQIEKERKKTDKILEELENEVEKKVDMSGPDTAYALNDVLVRIRNSRK